ncbi:hypothetical protein Pmani_033632 [Petrolisthes manimaculis]|uniref:Uncharacterized protein n=1 Tax=Petrolisthes manimaculis TaxID=1843537 RepID=A0AAE1TSF6_9EUCA|nr:hypothetical protein Pmani_033632 [Petrolisthes manimaculis]
MHCDSYLELASCGSLVNLRTYRQTRWQQQEAQNAVGAGNLSQTFPCCRSPGTKARALMFVSGNANTVLLGYVKNREGSG